MTVRVHPRPYQRYRTGWHLVRARRASMRQHGALDTYRDYRRRVWMLFPFPRAAREPRLDLSQSGTEK